MTAVTVAGTIATSATTTRAGQIRTTASGTADTCSCAATTFGTLSSGRGARVRGDSGSSIDDELDKTTPNGTA
jgi:hypothetical protein